jgi:alpha,alpha-trehalase
VSATRRSETPPHTLREYALLADGERGVLVGPHGDMAWMCFPRWDSDGVFASLIGGGGTYTVTPAERFVWGGYYEPSSLIWRSRWVTVDHEIVECREALALPAQPNRAIILRRVMAQRGTAHVNVALNPRGRFGAEPVRNLTRSADGTWRGRLGEIHIAWSGADAAHATSDHRGGQLLTLELRLPPGAHHDLALVLALAEHDDDAPPDADASWAETEEAWRERIPGLEHTAASRDASHAYAVLRGLTSAGGGMVAAATMSLPERAQQGRNYDYRYVWIRDQCYAGKAVATLGPHALLDDAVAFVRDRLLEDGAKLKPAYTTTGGRVPDERHLDLPGYPGGNDVLGNWVNDQFQLDAFGEALLLFAAAAAHDHLDADGWRAAQSAAETIRTRWHEPDAGIWELQPDAWTHSRLICVAGLRAISTQRPAGEQTASWLALADAITADTSARALHPSGRWQRSPTDPRPDAALLLAAVRGAIPYDDPRSLATLHSFTRELAQDGYAYRYRPDARPLGETEGAFLLCGFIASLAFGQQGDTVAAARWFERNRAACGPPGLFAEEFDVTQRQLRGNLPQAFVHALLLECAVRQSPRECEHPSCDSSPACTPQTARSFC